MRPGSGAEWIRHLDASQGHSRPLMKLIRPLMGFLVKLRRLVLREKHWL